ncbi:MAG: aspartyl-tRNA(Asn)/glutamyl-tRNA(Gln) amidotransferase subunit, partial [Patescibacteria group bacterium]|nr:aspartyl-tRNA(Asn)/glutamyl-tRNA(Gln) amidotransferase subunit [Patescibacteria group bacterium]
QISRDDVAKLAVLSSLQLEEAEIPALQADLQAILGYVAQLDELDTEGVEPSYQVTGLTNVLREDIAVEDSGVTREQLINLAAESKDNQVKVPKVM